MLTNSCLKPSQSRAVLPRNNFFSRLHGVAHDHPTSKMKTPHTKNRIVQLASCVCVLLFATASLQAQTTVKLNGAPPVAQPVKNKQAEIESKSGAKLDV